jgi:hypothetical protein
MRKAFSVIFLFLWLLNPAYAWTHGNNSGQFQIVLIYDSSTSSAPAGFKPAMNAAAAYLGSLIYLNSTIHINVGWGEVDGSGVGGDASSVYFLAAIAYTDARTALIAHATSANAMQAVSTLPSSAPSGVSFGVMTTAQEIALGLTTESGTGYAFIGFNTGVSWSYSGTPTAGQIDFREAALHEMMETMGRFANLSMSFGAGAMSIQDFYGYASNGTRNLTTTGARYFSINSGATNQRSFQTSPDYGDWSGGGLYAGAPSPFDGSATSGQLIPLLPCDFIMIDVLGYSSQ